MLVCSACSMSGVGMAIMDPPTEHESVRLYLKQAILPAITEALSAMEKEKCALIAAPQHSDGDSSPMLHAFVQSRATRRLARRLLARDAEARRPTEEVQLT